MNPDFKQKIWDLLSGYEEQIEVLPEHEQEQIVEFATEVTTEINTYRAGLIRDAIANDAELERLDAEYEIIKAQAIKACPELTQRIADFEQGIARAKERGLRNTEKGFDLSKFV